MRRLFVGTALKNGRQCVNIPQLSWIVRLKAKFGSARGNRIDCQRLRASGDRGGIRGHAAGNGDSGALDGQIPPEMLITDMPRKIHARCAFVPIARRVVICEPAAALARTCGAKGDRRVTGDRRLTRTAEGERYSLAAQGRRGRRPSSGGRRESYEATPPDITTRPANRTYSYLGYRHARKAVTDILEG